MCVPRRRLHLCMAKQFPDHRKALTKRQSSGGEGMAQIVNPYVLQSGALSDAFPGWLKITKVPSRASTEDDPRPSCFARQP